MYEFDWRLYDEGEVRVSDIKCSRNDRTEKKKLVDMGIYSMLITFTFTGLL